MVSGGDLSLDGEGDPEAGDLQQNADITYGI